MLQPNDRYYFPGSDTSFSENINDSAWSICQGSNCDNPMLREAIARTSQETEKEKSNSSKIIQIEIAVNLIFLSIVLISQLTSNFQPVSNVVDAQSIEQQKLTAY